MRLKTGILALVGTLVAASPYARAAATNVSFSTLTGSATNFVVGTGANAVTFSSAVPGTFSVANTGLYSGLGTALGDYSSFSGDTLTIGFASPTSLPVMIPFGIEDAFGSGDTLTLTTNTGVVTTATTTPDSSPFPEPEGTALVNATGYTTLTLTSANPFAIGGVTSVPEPWSITLVGVGLLGLVAARRARAI